MVTVVQAAKKWCPMARAKATDSDDPAVVNRGFNNKPDTDCMCLADGCMMWRWATAGYRRVVHAEPYEWNPEVKPGRPVALPDSWEFLPADGDCPASWREPEEEADKRRTGYCGIAGNPGVQK